MHLTLRSVHQLTGTTLHHAFTDLCQWRGRYYCAYRVAQTHHPTPRGSVEVQAREGDDDAWYAFNALIAHPLGDVRDPRFIVSDDALYLMCGVYLPSPQYRHRLDGLTMFGGDNTLVTHLAYTTDGETWSDLAPILRPNHWGWSALALENAWCVAAYCTGTMASETSSIVLYSGHALFGLTPLAPIYDGASWAHEGTQYIYRASSPCEPVLYRTPYGGLACLVRTESRVALGVGRGRGQWEDWHWWHNPLHLHPSAILHTLYGDIVAARTLTPQPKRKGVVRPDVASTDLYSLHGQRFTHLLRLPSAGDCGYTGLALGPEPDTLLVSYYSQHATYHQGQYGTTLPGSAVYMATVGMEE